MPISIVPITEADIPDAVQCIQDSFDADPYNNWVFKKDSPPAAGGFDKARNFASLKAKCDWGMRSSYALFFVAKEIPEGGKEADGKLLGVSMWTTPAMTSQPQTWSDWFND